MKSWDMVTIKFGRCPHRPLAFGLGYFCLPENAVYLQHAAAEVVDIVISHECIHSVILKITKDPYIAESFDRLFRKKILLRIPKDIRETVLMVIEENGMPRR